VADKLYIIFAGINGAGKSTLYRSGAWQRPDFPKDMERINSDEILKANCGDWSSQADQIHAMKEAVKRIDACFELGCSFNQETTLAGKRCIQDIIRAHGLGFKVIMFYIGVNNPQIANTRIAYRVSVGGHSIAPDIVERRFTASISNLKTAISICDEVYLFDNSFELTLIMAYRKGVLVLERTNPTVTWMP